MRNDIERLLAMLCNDQTDPESYAFVLKQLLEMLSADR